MNILYVCQYFPPEVCAPAVRALELSREWAHAGHEVTVLTGFPNHPEGAIHPEYVSAWRKGFRREDHDGVKVCRAWLYPAANQGVWRRSANYLSFAVSAVLAGPWVCPNRGIVIATSPQLLAGAAGYAVARCLGLPFIFEVRDLWPESLEAVGAASRQSCLYRSLQRLARFLYSHAERIVVDGHAKRRALAASGVPESKIAVIQNGVAEDLFPNPDSTLAEHAREALRTRFGLGGKFVVMYCGTFGMAHGLDALLQAAAQLRGREEIVFLLVGEGSERKNICRRIGELNLTNVRDLGKQPRENVPNLLSMADASLVSLRPADVFRTAIPFKIFESMAAARPIILAVEGDARQLVMEAQAGIAVPPGNPASLAEAVLLLQQNRAFGCRLGANGRRAVLTRYTRRQQALAYLNLLAEVEARRGLPMQGSARAAQPAASPSALRKVSRLTGQEHAPY
jgi:colanic acid biosynthesis glycosyl transferase WcaI